MDQKRIHRETKEDDMSTNIEVKKLTGAEPRIDPVLSAVEVLMNNIRARAYELFSARGFDVGHALDDWLKAEREFAWPAAEFVEEDRAYQLKIALPGYTAEQVKVTVTPQEIIVSAAAEKEGEEKSKQDGAVQWSEFKSNEVCRRIELPNAIDTNEVKASLQDGMLTVRAGKQAKAEAKSEKPAIPIAAAA
jgi:HSP20 family molecular chaperone IbpA